MSKGTLLVLILLTIFVGALAYSLILPSHPINCYRWQTVYKKITTTEYNEEIRSHLQNYGGYISENLTVRQLHEFLHERVSYADPNIENRGFPPSFERSEDPIEILFETKMGRCQEFTLAYTGLLSAYGYKVRMIIDDSNIERDSPKKAGDHMWVEVFMNEKWTHIDPIEANFDTGYAIDEPSMYALKWNKSINRIYAIDEEIKNITGDYQFEKELEEV